MKQSIDRILTTHTGSLPRPADLTMMLHDPQTNESALQERIRSAVVEAVQKQVAVRLDIVNDGEMGRTSYFNYVKDRLAGYEGDSPMPAQERMRLLHAEFPEFSERFSEELRLFTSVKRPACSGPIVYTGFRELERDIENLRTALSSGVEEAFLSAASPGVVSIYLGNRFYPSHESHLQAAAAAMKSEYDAIYKAGFLLQLDCPDLANTGSEFPTRKEFRNYIEMHVDAINTAVADIPPDRMRMHICWGNYEGPHNHDVPLSEIIDIVLKARPAALLYEASNPRHEHEWKVFKYTRLPDGKLLIPGVIDTTTNFIEHPELVAERICKVATLVGRENVLAGTDCGFASVAGMSRVDSRIAWAKLRALTEGAAIASRELW
jgi:5-methyltetrahydropteroyltriglutamate--homocysteine methyltransferase